MLLPRIISFIIFNVLQKLKYFGFQNLVIFQNRPDQNKDHMKLNIDLFQ